MFRSSVRQLLVFSLFALVVFSSGFAVATEWPGLRGPSFDGSVRDVALFQGNETALSVGWNRALGSGYSGIAVVDS